MQYLLASVPYKGVHLLFQFIFFLFFLFSSYVCRGVLLLSSPFLVVLLIICDWTYKFDHVFFMPTRNPYAIWISKSTTFAALLYLFSPFFYDRMNSGNQIYWLRHLLTSFLCKSEWPEFLKWVWFLAISTCDWFDLVSFLFFKKKLGQTEFASNSLIELCFFSFPVIFAVVMSEIHKPLTILTHSMFLLSLVSICGMSNSLSSFNLMDWQSPYSVISASVDRGPYFLIRVGFRCKFCSFIVLMSRAMLEFWCPPVGWNAS